jgi:hypothetical protein
MEFPVADEQQTGDEGQNEGTTQQTTDGKQESGTTSTTQSDFKAPASQEELNRIIAERVARVESKYKDVADLRKKASEYDKLVDAQKTETQKILERAEAAEKRAAELEAAEQDRIQKAELAKQIADWKTEIAADPKFAGVPASALRGSTEEELREHAAELKALIPDPDPRRGAYVPSEGRHTGSGTQSPRDLFAEIIQKT